jgi:glycosyltransferase involved in cell wall biosynthesis
MNIVWFSWKDINHPQAGGAELVSFNLMKNLVKDGHQVRLVTARYDDASDEDEIGGIKIYRTGGRFSVYLKARKLYKKQLKDWPDLVIDEMNTIPFGAAFYSKKRTILLSYQLARQVWFYQMPFPVSVIGFLLEPVYLFILSRVSHEVITESESTRLDMARFGFDKNNTSVIRVGLSLQPLQTLPKKDDTSSILFLGALRPMKRALDAIKGFEHARDADPSLTLAVAGDDSGSYADKVKRYVAGSRHKDAIRILGRVSTSERLKLMKEAGVILVTSVKEGWGLIVTEAGSQGTPAITYDVDGLRDSVQHDKTGILVPAGDTRALGEAVNQLRAHPDMYEQLREKAWWWSQEFTFDGSYEDFKTAVFDKENQ